MSAYKQLNSQDLIVSPLEVNKGFYFKGGDILTGSDVGINRFTGSRGDYLTSGSQLSGTIPDQQIPSVLVYDSIKQLYYTNYLSGSAGFTSDAITSSVLLGANEEGNTLIGGIQSTNFYNYEQTTLWPNKTFPTSSIGVISIPSKLFGDYIQPNSFYIEGINGSIKDDGEGRLLYQPHNPPNVDFEYMGGNIIYQHGIITLFNSKEQVLIEGSKYGESIYGSNTYGGNTIKASQFIKTFLTSSNVTMSFSSSYKLYETQYKATILENEFNYTLNPSAISGSTIPTIFSGSNLEFENTASYGKPYDFVTASYFDPYITTVGLYDNNFQLLAVGKLAKPLQTSAVTDTTILVNIDR
jgi:hypothetical protein|tara:strand:- start:1170 stop:2231 length:1062 start_codon:yes stop_codon:yes gene_type:complete